MKKITLIFTIIFPFLLISQTQIGQIINGEAPLDRSGWSVSMSSDGSIVAIGAPQNDDNGENSGHVRVYQNQNGIWVQLGQDIEGEAAGDESGEEQGVALSDDGNILAIGARFNDGNGSNAGHVRVYEFNGIDTWLQIGQDINGEAEEDRFGTSLSISSSGTILAIGARLNDGVNGNASGHVRIYEYDGIDTWVQLGQDIDGEDGLDRSGSSVSLSSDGFIVAIGAPTNDATFGGDTGHVRVYEYNGIDNWFQLGQDIDGEGSSDDFGIALSLSGDGKTVVIGASGSNDNGLDSGEVEVYRYNDINNNWEQIGEDIVGEASLDSSGRAVSISSNGLIIAVGALLNDGNTSSNSTAGHVRVFENISGTWVQLGEDIDGSDSSSTFGRSVSLSDDGTTLAIGGTGSSATGDRAGLVRVFEINSTTCSESQPSIPVNPIPANEAIDIILGANNSLNFSWLNGSGDSGTSFTLQIGTASVDEFAFTNFINGSSLSFLENNTTYLWRVDSTNCAGTTIGTVWSFTTGITCTVSTPTQVVNPTPADGATDVILTGSLNTLNFGWENGTGDPGTSNVLNIGTSNPPTEFQFGNFVNGSGLNSLSNNTTYYWSVDVTNCDGTTTGSVWSFTTGETLSVDSNEIKKIRIYPNPTSDILHIETLSNLDEIKVYNLLGQNIVNYTKIIDNKISLSQLNKGFYFIKILSGNEINTFRITKN